MEMNWRGYGDLRVAYDVRLSDRFVSAVGWVIPHLAPVAIRTLLSIEVKTLKQGLMGACFHLPKPGGENPIYLLELDISLRENVLIKTVMHELTHVSQYVSGRLSMDSDHKKIWEGAESDQTYWDCPWEVDARAQEELLYFAWKKHEEKMHK